MSSRFNVTYSHLILHGVHIGHSFFNSILFSSWLIYTYVQNILIINLFKSVLLLRAGFWSINAACYLQCPVWFINLDKAVSVYVKLSAYWCGEFSWTYDWFYGMLANFFTFLHLFRRLYRYSSLSFKGRQRWAADTSHFFSTRFTWPRATFVSSVYHSYQPVKEAINLGIPCLGVTDTMLYVLLFLYLFQGMMNHWIVYYFIFFNFLLCIIT